MKTVRALLLALVVLASAAASAAPILAASQKPTHPTAGYVLDGQPTPTPILLYPAGDGCSGGGC